MRTGFSVVVVAALLVILAPIATAANEEAEQQALKAAEEWLSLMDTGKYPESWEQASRLFRGAVKKEQWEQTAAGVRNPLGALVSRAVGGLQYATSLPGAPDGEYVVIQFTTSFENKATAVETVTPMRDDDGQWRVSGYFIK